MEQAQETGAADGVLERFDEKLQLLAEFPGMGEAKPDLGEGVRTLPVGNYLLVYRPAAEGIELLRVLHGARDLRRLFFPPRPGETGR